MATSSDLFIEMREISKNSKYENQTMYQQYQGQLNLSIVQDQKQLCVNIESARHLVAIHTNVYVKIKLTHPNNKRTIHRTQTLHADDPVWNYSCNMKRKSTTFSTLLLSLWSQNSECLGCMTFHIIPQSTCTTVAEGWHFLLHKSLGTAHHLKVTNHQPGFHSHSDNKLANTIRASYSTFHTIRLHSSSNGYGMKLSGQHPVRVCKVLNGSIAAEAGILSNDSLARINNLDVSSLDLSSVVQLIQESDCSLQLTIARQPLLDVIPLQQSPRKLQTTSTTISDTLNSSCAKNINEDVYSSSSDLLMYDHCRH